jgi:C-terminal processing protease CtpA/Prc
MSRPRLMAMIFAVCVALNRPAVGGDSAKCTMPLQECLDRMSAALKTTGWVGIEFDNSKVVNGGYTILKVVPGSPAEKAGLQPGDVLYALNGVRLAKEDKENLAALAAARKEWKPGQSVTYTVKREGVDREITLTLAPMPADVMARWIGEHMKEHEAAERAAAK